MGDKGSSSSASTDLLNRSKEVTPGGVHSGARITHEDLCFASGHGATVVDVSGSEYVDHICGWGTISLGHCDQELNAAVADALSRYDSFGIGTTELEYEAASLVKEHVPSADRVLFGMTGTEVVAHAIRLARAITGRKKIVKFQGHYNGWYDSVAMNHATPASRLGTKDLYSEGILQPVVDETTVLPYNDLGAVEETVQKHGPDIAAIILEPIAHNMGCVRPKEGYLEGLRKISDKNDSLLIFDEVITGFRHHLGGVQAIEGVTPDLTTMGKAGANGYPGSILCGKAEYMNEFDLHGDRGGTEGSVIYGGTYNAHPASVAAFKHTIELMQDRRFHRHTEALCDDIVAGISDHVEDRELDATIERYKGVWLTYFTDSPVRDWSDVLEADSEKYQEYRRRMVDQGILMSQKVRRNYLTGSHTETDARETIEAAGEALQAIAE